MTRKATRLGLFQASPHSSEPPVNRAMLIMYRRLVPNGMGVFPRVAALRLGTNLRTLVKVPDPFGLGRNDNGPAVAGVTASTLPGTSTPNASTCTVTVWPTLTRPILVSSMLALTHSW